MRAEENGRVHFGDCELDLQAGKLYRQGRPVKIQPQPLRVLSVLVERPGEIISRDQLRESIWGEATFVEFDQGLNYCIRQIRIALGEEASEPVYIETLPKQGYRFIARVHKCLNGHETPMAAEGQTTPAEVAAEHDSAAADRRAPVRSTGLWIAAGVAVLAAGTMALYHSNSVPAGAVKYTQLTDFTDSALAPALSPDGRMVGFIRGSRAFLSADQIYVKMLPDGEARRLTDDPRMKYGVAFSPDGSQIAYTVLEPPNWKTYTVSVLGGDTHLLLSNAAGLTWLDPSQFLFSETRVGQHMGIVTGTLTSGEFRDLYFPPHERAMAHYSFASPDRKSALVVEMNEVGGWAPCRLIALDGRSARGPIGPQGPCVSAGWSPDGSWMYFTAVVNGQGHLWRQRFPDGRPEQLTFGPTEEEGVAVEPDGRSVITAMGEQESAIWMHDPSGEQSLSSEGEIVANGSSPAFGGDGETLYYLLRRKASGSGPELWRMALASGSVDFGKGEALFPGVAMQSFDVSPDGRQIVYSTAAADGKSQLWLASIDRRSAPKRIGSSNEIRPHFGPDGQILFQASEGKFNYLEQMSTDGSRRSKVVPYPISDIQGISPGRRWVLAIAPLPDGSSVAPMAIPVNGGPSRILCASYCVPIWSANGKFLFIPVETPSRSSRGRSLAIPVGPQEALPEFPRGGIKPGAQASVIPGAQSVPRAALVPGKDPSHYVYVNTTVHRNLYRIALP